MKGVVIVMKRLNVIISEETDEVEVVEEQVTVISNKDIVIDEIDLSILLDEVVTDFINGLPKWLQRIVCRYM